MSREYGANNGSNGERKEFSSHPGNFEILSPGEFFDDFKTHAIKARRRALAQTMYVEPGEAFNKITSSLKSAKTNGAEAALYTDYYSFMVDEQQLAYIPSWKRSNQVIRKEQRAEKRDIIKDLEDSDVTVVITNPPKPFERIFPFKGRNHIKLAIVDDVAWVGGVSYRDADLKKEDFMMRVTDLKIVNALSDVFHMVNENKPVKDFHHQIDEETRIIVDRGGIRHSSIFDYALCLVQDATDSVRFSTQYAPNGVMVNVFSVKHKEGKNVSAVVSENSAIVEWYGRVIDRINTLSTKIKRKEFPLHLSKIRVHAKALLVDENIPELAVGMVGSHNLTRSGVMLGTQELGLFSSNAKFIDSLKTFFDGLETRVAMQSQEGKAYES